MVTSDPPQFSGRALARDRRTTWGLPQLWNRISSHFDPPAAPLATLASATAIFALSRVFDGRPRLALGLTAEVLVLTMAVQQGIAWMGRDRRTAGRRAAALVADDDPRPTLLSRADGHILWRNRAALAQGAAPTVAEALGPQVADGAAVASQVAQAALRDGAAADAAATARGSWQVSAQRIDRDALLWRVVSRAGRPVEATVSVAPVVSTESDWSALEALPIPLLRLSPDGVVLAANRHARLLLPMPPQARFSDLLEGLGRPLGEWLADVAAGRALPGPQFLRGRGEAQDVVLRVALTLAGTPAAPHLLAVLDDVTELKALEAQFTQSQKMQALGQLAGGVAHDFNNLLTAIQGHSDLLLLRHTAQDPDYADLIQIRQNVNRAASLVGQLLAFSRKQSMMPETLDLRVVLSELTHLLNRLVGEKVRLVLNHEPTLRCVRGDKRLLEQVIMNLVVNARDAMPDGGGVRIETANHHLAVAETRDRAVLPAGDYVVVRVIDEGVGIPPERLNKIFDPFYTTKRPGEGTGLGLATVYGIVKQSGAYVFVESEVGRGSTFSLWFPAHDRSPTEAAPAPAAAPRALTRQVRGTVLLAEDEAGVRAFAARALRMRGHTVIEADSGEAALLALAEPGLRIDLILSDVILPDADGPTWVRQALAQRPGIPVVFVSGYAEDAFTDRKALISGSTFLPKPFSLVELIHVVEGQLAAAPSVA